MANVFIHFEPIGSTDKELVYGTTDLPPYLIPGSPEEANWRERNPNGHSIMKPTNVERGATEAHRAAMEENLHELKEVVDAHEEVVHAKDANGWLPVHEAVRRGNIEIVKFLVDRGSHVNARTQNANGPGGSVLWWAINRHGEDSDIAKYLMELGAMNIEPEVDGAEDEL